MLVQFTSYPSDSRIFVITTPRMEDCTRFKRGNNKALLNSSKGIMVVMHRSGINVELFQPHSITAAATSKANVYTVP